MITIPVDIDVDGKVASESQFTQVITANYRQQEFHSVSASFKQRVEKISLLSTDQRLKT